MKNLKTGPNQIEKTMGLLWNIIDDTISALPRYNLHGSSRGRANGPDLVDMKTEDIMKMLITRMTFLRLSAQTYSLLKFYVRNMEISPATTSVVVSR